MHSRSRVAVLLALAGVIAAPVCLAQSTVSPKEAEAARKEALKTVKDAKEAAQPTKELKAEPAAPAMAQPGQTQPSALELSDTKYDFGDIDDTAPVEHKITFKNTSSDKIKIAATPSCGCTTAPLTKIEYAPGESGELVVKFDPHGRVGPQTKSLTFTVTEPAGKYAQQIVSLTSNIKALVTFNPPKMFLSEVDHREGQTGRIVIQGRKKGFQLTKVESNSPFVTTKIGEHKEVDVNGEKLTEVTVEIMAGKGAPLGNLNSQLTFESNDEKAKLQPYYFGADVIGDVKSTPTQAILRVNTPNTPFKSEVRIDSRSASAFTINSLDVKVTSPTTGFKPVVDAQRSEDGKYYIITLSGSTPATPGIIQGQIVVETDSQGGETLTIPFTGMVAQQATNNR